MPERGTTSADATSLLASHRGRIVFVHVPILVSSLTVTLLFVIASHTWSGSQTLAAGAALAFIWTAFVVVPLLILVTPTKGES